MIRLNLKTLIIVLCCLSFSLAWALPEDREKEITGQADRQTFAANSGTTVLIGNVIIRQGALTIYADKVTIETDETTDELSYMLAEGTPVRFIDTPSADDGEVTVTGATIEFFPLKNTIITLGDAKILQTGNQAQGERIEYDTVTGIMIIESRRVLTGNDNDAQAEFILQPGSRN